MLLPYMLALAINLGPVQPFIGKDLLPSPSFVLKGHNPDDLNDKHLTPVPYIYKSSNGDTLLYIEYTSPIEGECGVFSTDDTYASMDHVDLHGAFETKAGQSHLAGGLITAADEDPKKFIVFVVCLPLDVKSPAEARAKAKYSTRYEVSTFPAESS